MKNLSLSVVLLLLLVGCELPADPEGDLTPTPTPTPTATPTATPDETPTPVSTPTTQQISDYCTDAVGNCTGADEIFVDQTACEEAAGQMWSTGVTSGDSIECRTYHAGTPASGDPAAHCPHASESGGGTCGDWCESYCRLAEANCTGSDALFADTATCLTACAGYPDAGSAGDTSGDTVQCRIYHLGAARANAAVHCPHGAEDGGGVCN